MAVDTAERLYSLHMSGAVKNSVMLVTAIPATATPNSSRA